MFGRQEIVEKKNNKHKQYLYFQAQFGKPLDYQEHGYVSVIGFVTAYPDIVRLDRPNPKSDWILYDTRLPVPQGITSRTPMYSQLRTSGRLIS